MNWPAILWAAPFALGALVIAVLTLKAMMDRREQIDRRLPVTPDHLPSCPHCGSDVVRVGCRMVCEYCHFARPAEEDWAA